VACQNCAAVVELADSRHRAQQETPLHPSNSALRQHVPHGKPPSAVSSAVSVPQVPSLGAGPSELRRQCANIQSQFCNGFAANNVMGVEYDRRLSEHERICDAMHQVIQKSRANDAFDCVLCNTRKKCSSIISFKNHLSRSHSDAEFMAFVNVSDHEELVQVGTRPGTRPRTRRTRQGQQQRDTRPRSRSTRTPNRASSRK
jgi:hypothetical protein